MMRPSSFVLLTAVAIALLHSGSASAQANRAWYFQFDPFASHRAFAPFLASRAEGRLAISRSVVDPRFDLDLGAGLDLLSWVYVAESEPLTFESTSASSPTVSIGLDLYGWGSRDLAIERNSIDHFVGVHISSSHLPAVLAESRLRVGRLGTIASDASDELRRVASRDAWMVDLEFGLGRHPSLRNWSARFEGAVSTRFNVGGRLVLPDVSSDSTYFSPSLGAEARWLPSERFPFTFVGGLELRYYPGAASVIEQSVRAGVKYGPPFGSGVYLLFDLHNGEAARGYPRMPSAFDLRITVGGEL